MIPVPREGLAQLRVEERTEYGVLTLRVFFEVVYHTE